MRSISIKLGDIQLIQAYGETEDQAHSHIHCIVMQQRCDELVDSIQANG